MKIGTAQSQQLSFDAMANRRDALSDLQRQIGSGYKVNRPGDAPVDAAEAERQRSKIARVEIDRRATSFAQTTMEQMDGALALSSDALQDMREALVAAPTASLSAGDRATLALSLRQQRDQLLASLNFRDGSGGWVFGGQGVDKPPFVLQPDGSVTYTARLSDQLVAELGLPVSIDGQKLADRVPEWRDDVTGNGVADPTNDSFDLFEQIQSAITALETNTNVPDQVRTTTRAIDAALEQVLLGRARVGEELKTAEGHQLVLDASEMSSRGRLSDLIDLDFAKAMSEMTQHQTALEAAMKTYTQVSRMSLFDHL